MSRRWHLAALVAVALGATPAMAQNTQRGAAVGGIIGAIAGGVIGDHNDEAGAGALIGGAVGAVTGASLVTPKIKSRLIRVLV